MTVLGFEEQQIMERTGHRSSTVRTYKRQSAQQLHEVSRALEPPQKSMRQHGDVEKENAITQETKDSKERNNAISVSETLSREENVQIPMSEKIIHFFVIFENKNNVL